MTNDTAARFGVEIFHKEYREFFIPGGQRYTATHFAIEGDWSAAAMLLVAGAVAGEVRVENISALSKQADTAILDALTRAGAHIEVEPEAVTAARPETLQAFTFDATHCPDLFPALAALAANAEGESTLYGVSRLIHKESNRAKALLEEYTKLGIRVSMDEEQDALLICDGAIHATQVESHNDHRIAMSLAVAGLCSDGTMQIADAECVAKSYPDFFEDLERIRIK